VADLPRLSDRPVRQSAPPQTLRDGSSAETNGFAGAVTRRGYDCAVVAVTGSASRR
jgi:hypothetical protein